VRIYLPMTMQGLRGLHQDARLAPAPRVGHAVTDEYRDLTPDIDEEEREYLVLMAAGVESLQMIATSGDTPRRIVVSADVDAAHVHPRAGSPTAVEVSTEITLRQCSSVHSDESDAEPDVSAAAIAMRSSSGVDSSAPAATDVSDPLIDRELLWFATQEIPEVLT